MVNYFKFNYKAKTLKHIAILLLLIIFITTASNAQIRVFNDSREINYDNTCLSYQEIEFNNKADWTFATQQQFWIRLHSNRFPLKNTPQLFLFKIPLKNIKKNQSVLVAEVNDPHINRLEAWIVQDKKTLQHFERTGDHYRFSTRPVPTSNFVFPISATIPDSAELIFAIEKRHTNLILPLFFYSEKAYILQSGTYKIGIGVFLGIAFLLLFFYCFLYFSIRESVYLWYFLFLLSVIIYILLDTGLMFQYLFPEHPGITDVATSVVLALSLIPYYLFFNQLLNLPANNLKLYRFNQWILILYALIIIVSTGTTIQGSFYAQEFWVKANRIISPIYLSIILIQSIYCVYRNIKFSIFTLISICALMISIIVYVLLDHSQIPYNAVTSNILKLGLLTEVIIMTIATAQRYKVYKEQSDRLLHERAHQQEQLFKSIHEYKFQEMQRYSTLLHDSVGAHLSTIRLNLETLDNDEPRYKSGTLKNVIETITNLSEEVRLFSHQLSPVLVRKNGLIASIQSLIHSINSNGQIMIQFESIGSMQEVSFRYELMVYNIIQELIQNILKHSEATEAMIQLILEKEIISIFAEDNGCGLDPEHIKEGLGFSQIRELIQFVKGNFNIHTANHNGCCVSIEFPLIPDEPHYANTYS